MIRLTKEYGIRTHIVHLSSSDAIDLVRQVRPSSTQLEHVLTVPCQAREDGVRISAETTYHYLHFTAEQVAASATLFKCCPPIREAENREKLWKARSLPCVCVCVLVLVLVLVHRLRRC